MKCKEDNRSTADVSALSNRQLQTMTNMIEQLARKAGFEKTPKLKISKDAHLLAKASFWKKKITVGAQLLTQWQRGEIDENDVEVTLAHEMGHLIDFDRKFGSVFFRYNAVGCFCFALVFVLPRLVWFPHLFEPWFPPVLVSLLWGAFFLWVIRAISHTVQLDADKKGADLLTKEQFANSYSKRRVSRKWGLGPIETWELLLTVVLVPSFDERLQNLGLETRHQVTWQTRCNGERTIK